MSLCLLGLDFLVYKGTWQLLPHVASWSNWPKLCEREASALCLALNYNWRRLLTQDAGSPVQTDAVSQF